MITYTGTFIIFLIVILVNEFCSVPLENYEVRRSENHSMKSTPFHDNEKLKSYFDQTTSRIDGRSSVFEDRIIWKNSLQYNNGKIKTPLKVNGYSIIDRNSEEGPIWPRTTTDFSSNRNVIPKGTVMANENKGIVNTFTIHHNSNQSKHDFADEETSNKQIIDTTEVNLKSVFSIIKTCPENSVWSRGRCRHIIST